ncbi:biotin--[acetyl-CoA-carboxylase] ligase [Nocardioides alcanivorans]|uniref:biotin--[acetyl-CoA-carboxylase] ligase n=1 Tax=Nocardioides alcanivorans TaxID=2897352 RepID=UPI001F2F9DE7|nr:biotin--[acetyl-CoA-carboxylase] ligase [Nocardioides alcanivorans]
MTSTPDARPPLDPSRLPATVEIVEEIGSTNAGLAERARAGAPAGTTLTTEWQTAGRGRLDRGWTVPERAALTFSTILRPDLAPADWPWLPLFAGYVVHEALVSTVPGVVLKWPNDVLVEPDGKKLCGILVERVDSPIGPGAVVGIGINADQTEEELPIARATSVRLATGASVDRTALLAELLATFEREGHLLDDIDELRRRYEERCITVGMEVRVELPADRQLLGTAVGIDPSGRLLVRSGADTVAVGAGDVVHVRPAAS